MVPPTLSTVLLTFVVSFVVYVVFIVVVIVLIGVVMALALIGVAENCYRIITLLVILVSCIMDVVASILLLVMYLPLQFVTFALRCPCISYAYFDRFAHPAISRNAVHNAFG